MRSQSECQLTSFYLGDDASYNYPTTKCILKASITGPDFFSSKFYKLLISDCEDLWIWHNTISATRMCGSTDYVYLEKCSSGLDIMQRFQVNNRKWEPGSFLFSSLCLVSVSTTPREPFLDGHQRHLFSEYYEHVASLSHSACQRRSSQLATPSSVGSYSPFFPPPPLTAASLSPSSVGSRPFYLWGMCSKTLSGCLQPRRAPTPIYTMLFFYT